jgi:hypothetical protein
LPLPLPKACCLLLSPSPIALGTGPLVCSCSSCLLPLACPPPPHTHPAFLPLILASRLIGLSSHSLAFSRRCPIMPPIFTRMSPKTTPPLTPICSNLLRPLVFH